MSASVSWVFWLVEHLYSFHSSISKSACLSFRPLINREGRVEHELRSKDRRCYREGGQRLVARVQDQGGHCRRCEEALDNRNNSNFLDLQNV